MASPAAPPSPPPANGAQRRGRLVSFEGIDGSGKSTVIARVAQTLRAEGLQVMATREETASATGDWVKRAVHERWDPLATTFLFLADRARHVREMGGWQDGGSHVLCDRFMHSTFAYQCATLAGIPGWGSPLGALPFLEGMHAGWCPMPDRVLLFTCDPAIAVRRVKQRAATTPYEKEAFLRQVQGNYLALAQKDPGRFTVIDSDQHIDVVTEEATTLVRKLLV
ncbi:MAG TPA: dTMP kinase [Candidatus Thermoplasmatota archaeon]|nr:dTMP kinase [Candidatus Thermoplasmatota archaeon]